MSNPDLTSLVVASPPAAPLELPTPPDVPVIGQGEAIRIIEAGMRLDARVILLIGPIGAGKSTHLRNLSKQGLGFHAPLQDPWPTRSGWWLLDATERSSPGALDRMAPWLLEDPKKRALIALPGNPPPRRWVLQSEDLLVPVFSPSSLVQATFGLLPTQLAELVQITACFRALDVAELKTLGRRLASGRADLDEAALDALAQMAYRSGEGASELAALMRRLPRGTWSLKAPYP